MSSRDLLQELTRRPVDIFMTSKKMSRVGVLFFSFLVSTAIVFGFSRYLQPLEESLGAAAWALFPDGVGEERITLVAIDEASLAEIGPWPWSRSTMAELVDAISAAGAQLQIHDIVYPESREGDERFLSSLLQGSGSVIAQVPALNSPNDTVRTGFMTHQLTGVDCVNPGVAIASTTGFVAPTEILRAVPKGHNGAMIDRDGGVRVSPAVVCVDGSVYPSLAVAAFLQLDSRSEWTAEINRGRGLFEPENIMTFPGYPGLEIPLDRSGAMRIDYRKTPDAFQVVSASDVLLGRIDSSILENVWALVGGTAFGMADIVPTPYSGAAFGIELQARMLTSILDTRVPFSPNGSLLFHLVLILVFASLLYAACSSSRFRLVQYVLPFIALGMPIAALGIHGIALLGYNFWIGWLYPAVYGITASVGMLILELARARSERSRVYENLSSYLSPLVAREIAFSLPTSDVAVERREVTLLNADIRNFSAFGESRPPEEAAAILHYFFVRASEIIESCGGRVEEARGDGLLAVWEDASAQSARQALEAANLLQGSFGDNLSDDLQFKGLAPLALGIGAEQGPVLIGSIGPSHRRVFALLGDTVSVTMRIQEMTAELAQPILLGTCISRHLKEANVQSQGSYLLPGLTIPHTLFAPAPSAEVLHIRTPAPSPGLIDGRR